MKGGAYLLYVFFVSVVMGLVYTGVLMFKNSPDSNPDEDILEHELSDGLAPFGTNVSDLKVPNVNSSRKDVSGRNGSGDGSSGSNFSGKKNFRKEFFQ